MANKTAFEWPGNKGISIRRDSLSSPRIGRVSGVRATSPYGAATFKFAKTNLIGLANYGSPYGGVYVAYQLWKRVNVSGSMTTGNGYYVRRAGRFGETGGQEYFAPYTTVRRLTDVYALRILGKTYRNAKEEEKYIDEVRQIIRQSGGVFTDFLEKNKFDFKTDTFDIKFFDKVTGIYNPNPSGSAFLGLEFLGQALAVITSTPGSINPQTPSSGGGGGGGGGGSGGTAPVPTLPNPVVRIITRMPLGYAGIASSKTRRPSMVQRYTNDKNQPTTDEFTFKYVPQGIQYSGLASEWSEIPRADDVPFVDWSKYQLMKVSFSFIVADDRVERGGAVVPDGLLTSVDSQLEKLRAMAQRKVPVVLQNFDDMLTFQLRRGAASTSRTAPNMEFVISDFSVTATRRVTDDISGSPVAPSSISVAQCDITLTEIPVEQVGIVALPPILSPAMPIPRAVPSTAPQPLVYADVLEVFAPASRASNVVYGP
jgi:hypothetical protein